MPGNSKSWKTLSVLFMLLFIAALGIRFFASSKTGDYLGPTHIASNHDVIFVHLNGDLIQLDSNGKLLNRFTSQQTGLERPPIDLRVLSDGRLLYAEQQPARIRLCDTHSWECDELGAGVVKRFRRQYKVWLDESNQQLIFTDAAGGGVWAQPLAGGEVKALLAPTSCVANDLLVTHDGRVWVADSGNFRLIELAQSAADISSLTTPDDTLSENEITREISTRHEQVRNKRDFPMMVAQDDNGYWWVTQTTGFSGSHADILLYDADVGVQHRIELPPGEFAFDITAIQGGTIFSEMDGYKLHRIDTATYDISEFGDATFRQLLINTRQNYIRYDKMAQHALIAMAVFGVLMIAAAVAATPKGKRWSPRPQPINLTPSETPMPPIQGVYWLKRNPATERLLRWGEPVFHLLIAALLVYMAVSLPDIFALAAKADNSKEKHFFDILKQLTWMVVISFALLPITTHIAFKAAKRRLGTDGKHVFILLANGKEMVVAPQDLLYTKNAIIYRQYTVPLQNGYKQPFYAEGELQSFIGPLLNHARKISWRELMIHLWQHRNTMTLFQLTYFIGIACGLIWFWLQIKAV